VASDPYVYYAQSKAHPSDPMYAKVNTRKYLLATELAGHFDEYFVFRFSPHDGSCTVITLEDVWLSPQWVNCSQCDLWRPPNHEISQCACGYTPR
jgi:hypothetical protein